jgi:hypothetical protein
MRVRTLLVALIAAGATVTFVPEASARTVPNGHAHASSGARTAQTATSCTRRSIDHDTVLHADEPCGVDVSEGVVLDLNGHTVSNGLGSCGAVVRNGTVAGGMWSCGDSTFEYLVVRDTTTAGQPGLEAGGGDLVRRNLFTHNHVGVDTYYADDHATIVDNVFRDNDTGVWNDASKIRIARNTFVHNGYGITIADENDSVGDGAYNRILDNVFSRNDTGLAIYAYIGGQGNAVRRNVFARNHRAGLWIKYDCVPAGDGGAPTCGGAGTVVADNTFRHNGFSSTSKKVNDGFYGASTLLADEPLQGHGMANVTVARNLAVDNFDLGIRAPYATDGGGNRAARNGNRHQCVGVVCRRP